MRGTAQALTRRDGQLSEGGIKADVPLLYVSAMYAIDERDRVILIDALPQPDVGAPFQCGSPTKTA